MCVHVRRMKEKGRRGEEGRTDACSVQSVRRIRGGKDKCVWWRECT